MVLFFTLIIFFEKINFSRGVGGSSYYFVEIPEGWGLGGGGVGSSVPYKCGKSREVGGS